MKFTTSGFLGVVATSNDVGFDYPTSSDDYDLPGEKHAGNTQLRAFYYINLDKSGMRGLSSFFH